MQSAEHPPVALVAGGVRGLGLASARALAARGARVWILYRSSHAAARALESEFDGRVLQADLCAPGAAERALERVLARDGRLDSAVHAVGDYESGALLETEPAALRALWQSNVESALLYARAVQAPLRSARGSLVFFGCAGLEGLRGKRTVAGYAMAKSALLVLARSLALELAPQVRVNVVSPGLVPHEHAHPDSSAERLVARVPLQRVGTPAEVGETVAWLCSPQASYVTGADVPVSGGWLL
jgi:NAD(P)-dependent dehydrogenase (short-subunit alcohol dehydrogenase family)